MEEEEPTKKYRCLCSFMHVRTGCIVIGIIEFLLIAHSLIYVCSNLAGSEKRYKKLNPDFAAVIQYQYLTPTLVVQSIWISSIIFMLLGIKAVRPLLTLPHFIMQICAVIYGIILFILFVIRMRSQATIIWELAVVIGAFLAVSLIEVYFAIVSYFCYKFLLDQKSAMESQKRITRSYRANVDQTKSKTGFKFWRRNRSVPEESSSDEAPTTDAEQHVQEIESEDDAPRHVQTMRRLPNPLLPPLRNRLPPLQEHSVESEEGTEYDGVSRRDSVGEHQPPHVVQVAVEHSMQDEIDPTNNVQQDLNQNLLGFGTIPAITVEPASDIERCSSAEEQHFPARPVVPSNEIEDANNDNSLVFESSNVPASSSINGIAELPDFPQSPDITEETAASTEVRQQPLNPISLSKVYAVAQVPKNESAWSSPEMNKSDKSLILNAALTQTSEKRNPVFLPPVEGNGLQRNVLPAIPNLPPH